MSRFIIILLLAIISGSNKLAAQIDSAQFLLRNFENGYVYYKDGRTFNVPLNYSLLIKKFLFQDQHDNNNIKEFSEPEMVATIKIGERIFLPTKDGATEVLQKDPGYYSWILNGDFTLNTKNVLTKIRLRESGLTK